uniref:Uncharacterized protein n=1 Tax=Ditylenchus dipsaci TaxID=166011 RepID=A0A915EDJ1_9BILA
MQPSTSAQMKTSEDQELEEIIQAVARMQIENKEVGPVYRMALDELIKREQRLKAEKEDLQHYRHNLFEQIRAAIDIKKEKHTRDWSGEKTGFYIRGPSINAFRQLKPPSVLKSSYGAKYRSSNSKATAPTTIPSVLAVVAKNEEMQIAPPNRAQTKKEYKKSGKEFVPAEDEPEIEHVLPANAAFEEVDQEEEDRRAVVEMQINDQNKSMQPSTSAQMKTSEDQELEEIIQAVACMQIENKEVGPVYRMALDELIKREQRLKTDNNELIEREQRLKADNDRLKADNDRLKAEKEDLQHYRHNLFEQIRGAIDTKQEKHTREWSGEKTGFYIKGPSINTVRQLKPPSVLKSSYGAKYRPFMSRATTPTAIPPVLAVVAKNEEMQIAPPNRAQTKKDDKKSGKNLVGARNKDEAKDEIA